LNPEKKKIIYISVRSDFGGGTYHIDLLINDLTEAFDIYVAAPLNKPYGFKWRQTLGKNKFFELPFRSFKIISFLKLIRFIKNNEIQILHAHGKGAGIYGRLIKIFIREILVIYTFHGFHILEYNSLVKNSYILIERFLSKLTDIFINVSQGEKEICLHNKIFKESDSIVMYNAIKSVERSNLDKYQLRNKLSLPAEAFLIISVVRFNHQKNLKATVNIAKKLLTNRDILFLIVGDGEEKAEIENFISKNNLINILLLGYQSNIDEYLSASDIYLSTSLWEGLPYSLIEAAANGLPIVASDVTGNNEVVTDGENGYLFQLSKINDAVERLLQIKNSAKEQKLLSDNSLKIFNAKFQLDIMINKMKEIYNHSTRVSQK
jgi:glycosyltransferase involved in cell wall biosynthesis